MKFLQSYRFEDKFRNDLKMNITLIYQLVCNVIREKIALLCYELVLLMCTLHCRFNLSGQMSQWIKIMHIYANRDKNTKRAFYQEQTKGGNQKEITYVKLRAIGIFSFEWVRRLLWQSCSQPLQQFTLIWYLYER